MRKKRFLYVVCFLFLFSFSLAFSAELSNSWYTNFDTVVIDNVLYEVQIDSTGEMVFLTSQSEGIVHYVELYSELEMGNYELDFASNEYIYDEINTSFRYYRANLVLYSMEPELEANVSLLTDGTFIGERYTFEFYVENNGSAPIDGLTYSFIYSDLFELSSPTSCDYDKDKIYVTVNLDEQDDYDCKYTLIPQKSFGADLVSEVSYVVETENKLYLPVSVSVLTPLVTEVNLSSDSINLTTGANISVGLLNNGTSELDVDFVVYIPDFLDEDEFSLSRSFRLLATDDSRYGFNAYEYSRSIDVDESKEFKVEFMPSTSKDITVFYQYNYEFENLDVVSDLERIDIEVTESEVIEDEDIAYTNYTDVFNVSMNISTDYTMYALQSDYIYANFKNRLRQNITNVTATVIINNQTINSYFYPVVTNLLRIRLPEYVYTAPFVSENTDIDYELLLTFDFENVTRNVSAIETFTVQELPSASISKSVSNSEIGVSESTIVTLTANYAGESRSFPYNFSESIPDGFVVNGITQRTVRLVGEDEDFQIYEYELVAKDIVNETTYSILTNAFSAVEGYDQQFILNASVDVTVIPYADGIELSDSVQKSELGVGEINSIDLTIVQNGTIPVFNFTIRPVLDENSDISYEPMSVVQLNPGDERSYSFDTRFYGEEDELESLIEYSYYTREGILITRTYNISGMTLLVNDTQTYGPIGLIQADQTEYGEYNTTIIRASRSYDNLSLHYKNQSVPLDSSSMTINESDGIFYVTYEYLDRVFEKSIPVTSTVYVPPVDNTDLEIDNLPTTDTSTSEPVIEEEGLQLTTVQLLLLVVGGFIFIVLLGVIGVVFIKQKKQPNLLAPLSEDKVKKLTTPSSVTSSQPKSLSIKEKLAQMKKPEETKSVQMPKVEPEKVSKPKIADIKQKISEQKEPKISDVKKPEEKLSSLSLSDQLKQSRELLNRLKK